MKRSALFRLADRAVGGQLEAMIRSWVRAGVSRRAAARLLADALGGIEIDPNTVARWMREVAEPNGAAA